MRVQYVDMSSVSVCVGAGFGMMRLSSIVMVSCYFSGRRALATAAVLCGSGVGKLLVAPLSRRLIDTYGWRGANCIVAGLVLHAAVCGSLFRPAAAAAAADRRSASPSPRSSCAVMDKV